MFSERLRQGKAWLGVSSVASLTALELML